MQRSVLIEALTDCSAQRGIAFLPCEGTDKLRQIGRPSQGTPVLDPVQELQQGRFLCEFTWQGKVETIPVDYQQSVVEVRFILESVFPGLGLNDVHLVHEGGVVFPPGCEPRSMISACFANCYCQGLHVSLPLRVTVANASEIVRMQRWMVPSFASTVATKPDTPGAQEVSLMDVFQAAKLPDCQSRFKEASIALLKALPQKASVVSAMEVLEHIPASLKTAVIQIPDVAYFVFAIDEPICALSSLTLPPVKQRKRKFECSNGPLEQRKPVGVAVSGSFYSFLDHGAASRTFKDLGVSCNDIVVLRFCHPQAAEGPTASSWLDLSMPGDSDVMLSEGRMNVEQHALDVVEKLVFSKLLDDRELLAQLAAKLEIEIEQLYQIAADHQGRCQGAGANFITVGYEARAQILAGAAAAAATGGMIALGAAVVLPLVAAGAATAVVYVRRQFIGWRIRDCFPRYVSVICPDRSRVTFLPGSCPCVAALKLRLMAETGIMASCIVLKDLEGAIVSDEAALAFSSAYEFKMMTQQDDPTFACSHCSDPVQRRQLCSEQNFCSEVFTATLKGAAHAVFHPDQRPTLKVNEPPEYFCPSTTVLSYWEPTYQKWGVEQLQFNVDRISGHSSVTLPHFSHFALKTIVPTRVVAFDLDQLLHPLYDYDFTDVSEAGWLAANRKLGDRTYIWPWGWQRYAIQVEGKFDAGNDDWLGVDELGNDAWPVAYHGTSGNAMYSILKDGALSGGMRQVGSPTGTSISMTYDPEYAEKYAQVSATQSHIDERGRRFRSLVMFQVRVKPSTWSVQTRKSPAQNKRESLFENSDDIRLYGICVKKVYEDGQATKGCAVQ